MDFSPDSRTIALDKKSFGLSAPMRLHVRVLSGVAWGILGSVAAQGGTFLSTLVIARTLGKYSFGQFALIQSAIYALTSVAGLGLP